MRAVRSSYSRGLFPSLFATAFTGLAMGLSLSVRAAPVGDVFVIALENHDFTQPSTYTTFQQLKDNTAAPFLNSLITPGNPNAANVSYATNYTNAGNAEHPSEPNYLWAEAGTNYNVATNTTILSDGDPSTANKNIFSATPHLTGLMNTAGVSWKTYQEDYQVSGKGAGVTASGTLPGGATNPYNGSTAYSYGAKHDPMAFFSDTAGQNTSPISALATDLASNSVAQYNWITPNLYNDMHTGLTGGFTYRGVHYTGDQAGVAQGDNFLSIVVPQIEASAAFQNNGMIVIWNDETEGGDTTAFTSTEIVISPLAKGNAYASSVPLNHSSDIKTMQEIFNLGPTYLNNTIPTSEYSRATGPGTYNTVAGSNDFSDLLKAGTLLPLAQPATWVAGRTGTWSTAGNWTPAVIPNNTASSAFAVTIGIGTASLDINVAVTSLTLGGSAGAWSGTLDLTTSKLVLQTRDAASKAAALLTLQNQIASYGHAGSGGITSSTLPANQGLALLDNAVTHFTSFGGITVDANALLLAPELLGDANADGAVDLNDLNTVLNHLGQTTPSWTDGNFDNAPTIDLNDLNAVLNSLGTSFAGNATVTYAESLVAAPAPEPASLLVALPALLLFMRRSHP